MQLLCPMTLFLNVLQKTLRIFNISFWYTCSRYSHLYRYIYNICTNILNLYRSFSKGNCKLCIIKTKYNYTTPSHRQQMCFKLRMCACHTYTNVHNKYHFRFHSQIHIKLCCFLDIRLKSWVKFECMWVLLCVYKHVECERVFVAGVSFSP